MDKMAVNAYRNSLLLKGRPKRAFTLTTVDTLPLFVIEATVFRRAWVLWKGLGTGYYKIQALKMLQNNLEDTNSDILGKTQHC